MNIVAIIIAVLFVFSFIWKEYRKYLLLKYRIKFIALHNELKQLAIDSKIKEDSWIFLFLESSISNTITELKKVNMWRVLFVYYKNKNKIELSNINKKLINIFKEDPISHEVYLKHSKLIAQYIQKKHFLTFIFTIIGIVPILASIIIINNFIEYTRIAMRKTPILIFSEEYSQTTCFTS